MKKVFATFMTAIMTGIMVVSANVTARAEEERSGRRISDVVQAAKEVENGTYSATSIPLRIQNDVCRIWIDRDWRTEELRFEAEMLWGRYDPNPAPLTEQDIRDILMGALK